MPKESEGVQDLTKLYTSDTCVKYYEELMQKSLLVERCEIGGKYCEKYLVPIFKKWAEQLKKPLNFADLLCCYGNDTLAYAYGYYQKDFAETWSSDDLCYNLVKPRQFPVKTLGIDRSENALKFAKKAGIMDETEKIDFNNMTDSDKTILQQHLKCTNILYMNSMAALDDGIVEQIIEWFSQGTEPGMLMIGFIYPHDGVERMNMWKQLMLTKFDFLASVPSANRTLYEHEGQVLGPKHGIWDRTYYEMWYLTRKVDLGQK